MPNHRNEFSEIATFFPERAVLLAHDLLIEKGWSFHQAAEALGLKRSRFESILASLGVLEEFRMDAESHAGRFLEPLPRVVGAPEKRRRALAVSGQPDSRAGRTRSHATVVARIARIDPGEAIEMIREAYRKAGCAQEAASYLGYRGIDRRHAFWALRRKLGIVGEAPRLTGYARGNSHR